MFIRPGEHKEKHQFTDFKPFAKNNARAIGIRRDSGWKMFQKLFQRRGTIIRDSRG